MVDDKPIGGELPAGVQFIQVDFSGAHGKKTEAWPVVTSLQNVLEVLQKSN